MSDSTLELAYPVEIGDTVQVKQCLDESLITTLDATYPRSIRLDTIKVSLMIAACLFALIAQFTPEPFPESRLTLGICVSLYFVCSGLLQAVTTFVEKDTVFTAQDKSFEVRTDLKRFESDYSFKVVVNEKVVFSENWSIGLFFTEDGYFWNEGFEAKVKEVVTQALGKKKE
mmetsp:Transcript_7494/g.13554  ORF Transcript_7494/g.13554 Transcript_7494/m.13554 type:complete len:172 (-) Transcript_7494:49-564(-)|eukprot:CAMPEP_0182516698 /NCGR_PEP_ID=MMETSP1321-20130603/40849_1 /TAXON_ID=91990 /ORGANISM="Bolidomonas sp., Strain RCC1657" /LENGTH=171 /DNA_ID=CAMNT_0024724327 /DNA_START=219 /DNA_END=734 /DNA_ORIENTATION=-